MNKHRATFERIHDPAESAEIPQGGSLEIHRDMHIGHTELTDDTSLLLYRVIGRWQREVDDRLKTRVPDGSKLILVWLTGRAEFVANGAKMIDFGQRC